ncbi:MAG: hypothetical protein B6244_01775 [Candidatus Cloacimonetes bacterium 4572_55]|nr:MAG: hypothetical protein B6244_01775 [Candidatus Cloacimonetes bacterium 4572_55]
MKYLKQSSIHIILILGAVTMVLPFFWMVITSFKTIGEVISSTSWVPNQINLDNYIEAWEIVPFPRYFFNTAIIVSAVLVGVLITSALAAYAFSRMEFRGRDFIFMAFLATMMIPEPVYLVPAYLILSSLPNPDYLIGLSQKQNWIDTYYALTIPWMANVFSIFLLRQHFKTIPQDLFDAATIDGSSRLGILWRIVAPLSKPALVTVALFSIIGSWNSFMWPLVVTNSEDMRPIQVGLAFFAQEQGTDYHLMMAAATFCTLPLLILYFFAQKQIIQSFARSGLKD